MDIFFFKCVNSTKNNFICVDTNYIDKYVKSIKGRLFIFDYEIMHNNPNNPFIPRILEEENLLFFPEEFTVHKFIKKQVIYTYDTGYFYKNKNQYMEFLYDSEKIESPRNNMNIDYEGFSFLALYSEGKIELYFRKYKRFIEGFIRTLYNNQNFSYYI